MAKRSAKTKQRAMVMKEFRIDEISAVDSPAQQGAKALILKRYEDPKKPKGKGTKKPGDAEDDDDDLEVEDETKKFSKQARLLSNVNGHSHILDDTSMDNHTSWDKSPDDEYGHSHPWIRGADGTIVIGEADGHKHEILEKRVTLVVKQETPASSESGEPATSGTTISKENTMTEQEKAELEAAKKRATDAESALAIEKSVGALTDAEKAHYGTLDAAGKTAFLAKSTAERASAITKVAGDNPVVYVSANGSEFRKNDDPRLINMAKESDANAKTAREAQAQLADQGLAKRAETELAKLPGESAVKVALLKAIEGIADVKLRDGATALLKAGNEAAAKAFEKIGSSEVPAGGSVNDQLEKLAQKHAADHKVDITKARVAVLETPEGSALYGQLQAQPVR